eukprot:TRINITY_DN26142_c0_g1_i1.p1 TRINITY_DN26142_c0_g1~~TRINITY_DN26142_c0_g1_i1.p1  ORF type:complete len:113 (+),score=9.32 TRINITY_DN26142_c0_g1_i1:49-387(+)
MSKSRKKVTSKRVQRLVNTKASVFRCRECGNTYSKISKFEKHIMDKSSSCRTEDSAAYLQEVVATSKKLKMKLKVRNIKRNSNCEEIRQDGVPREVAEVVVEHLADGIKKVL